MKILVPAEYPAVSMSLPSSTILMFTLLSFEPRTGTGQQFFYYENIRPPLALLRQIPRYRRVVVADFAHHVPQRGNQRAIVFGSDQDRSVYLNLVKRNARDCGVSVLGYALMLNHVRWIVTPHSEEALAEAFGRTHYRYSHCFQA